MYHRYSAIVTAAALLILIAAPHARADSDGTEAAQAGQPLQAASRLQVTGSRQQFSIEADHADVQSALKAVFVQAGKQFDLDNGVAGQLTLKLDNQSLDTILASVCKQTFIKYHQDTSTGIYRFEQDAGAVKAAIAHVDTLNSLLRQQLRDFGLDLPADAQLDEAITKLNYSSINQPQNLAANGAKSTTPGSANAIRGQGAAGAALGGASSPSQSDNVLDKAGAPGLPGGQKSIHNGVVSKSARGGIGPTGAYAQNEIKTDYIPDYLLEQLLQASGVSTNNQSGISVDKVVGDYLKRNNLVTISTHGVAVPVTDVLAELSRQSGVAIMLDPSVPRGPRFRITLSLPACSLSEALNLILPPARLRWRTINENIFVTPTPEFQIFYGSMPVPYVVYGSNTLNRNIQNGQQSAGQNGVPSGGQGGGQAPGQNGNPK